MTVDELKILAFDILTDFSEIGSTRQNSDYHWYEEGVKYGILKLIEMVQVKEVGKAR